MKKFLTISMLICLVVCVLAGCGGGDSSSNKMEFEQLEWPTYENAKQIPIPKSTMADVRNNNDVRFEFYLANTTLEDYKDYVEECKAKGFTVEPVEQENRYYAFNEENYELTVQHQEGDIMYVCVVEERYGIEIKLLHADKTSADMYNIRVEIDGYWEEDSEQGDEAITFDTYLKEGTHTLTIENDDDDDINGRIDFTVSEDGEYFEFEINCSSNKVEIRQIGGTHSNNANSNNGQISGGVESEAETIVEILTMSRSEVLSRFPTATEDESDVLIPGTFAGLTGIYNVCISDGDVWRVIFERNETEIDTQEVVDAISEYFGDYVEYDTEWNEYEWETEKLELAFYVDEKAYFDLAAGYYVNDDDSDDTDENEAPENITTFVDGDHFTFYPYEFKGRFDDAFGSIKGYDFSSKQESDESKLFFDEDNYCYYRIQDKDNNYSSVGMYSFTKPNGKTVPVSEEFTAGCACGISILIEETDNVAPIVYATMLAIDPSLTADDEQVLYDSIFDNVGNLDGVTFNSINYVLYKENGYPGYHYLIVTVDGSDVTVNNSLSVSGQDEESSNQTTRYCIVSGCTRKGTKSYIGLSSQPEYYCETHYNELIDMMSDMEEDVGNSSYSKHTCEECSREGTYSIIGISGQTEYYCSTHYSELKEFLEIFG